MNGVGPDTVIYVCGPARIRFERFGAAPPQAEDRPLIVELLRSGRTLQVEADQSILDAALAAGVDARYSCKTGTCGSCAVKMLAGEPDHRDSALSDAERDRAGLFCTCVPRAHGEHLVLDL